LLIENRDGPPAGANLKISNPRSAISNFPYRLPANARVNVSSSADSSPPPAGNPCAMRVTVTGFPRSSSAR
jgi:hypothetical protein